MFIRHRCIAEIGTSHLGSLTNAKKLIDAAKDSGATCVKFQWVIADEIVSPLAGNITLPNGSIAIYDYFKSVEQPFTFYQELYTYAKQKKLDFLCSVFGLQSLHKLYTLHTQNQSSSKNNLQIKIASPEINHIPLLTEIVHLSKKTNIEIIISTGLASLIDVYNALQILHKSKIKKITILRCVTKYPAEPSEYNILLLEKYHSLFTNNTNNTIGLSDHSLHASLLPSLATALGSCMTEKHFTICTTHNTSSSPDDPIALNPAQFLEMSQSIAEVEKIYVAKGKYHALNFVKEKYGQEKITSILSFTNTHSCASLYSHYNTSRRSMCAIQDINKADILTEQNTSILRSETNLEPGIPAQLYYKILGKKINCNITKGQPIQYKDLILE